MTEVDRFVPAVGSSPDREYLRAMTYHTVLMPPVLQAWVDSRIAEGAYVDAADYLRDLVRRDQQVGEEYRWVREAIEEGLASGVLDQDPREVIAEILAEDPDLRD